jgi:hypothetical protein
VGLPINVFPVTQGFPRPPDGGVLTNATTDVDTVVAQAFAPPPDANLLPSEPTAPLLPFRPISQASPPVPVLSSTIPPALDVNTMLDTNPDADAPTFVVSDLGSYSSNQSAIMKTYTIASVVDYYTGAPPSLSSSYLRILLNGGSPFETYGVSFAGRTLLFLTLSGTTPSIPPERTILVYGDLSGNIEEVVVPNAGSDGTKFTWPPNPTVGDVVSVDTARYDDEVVSKLTGQVQDVVPQTTPLPTQLGTVYTNLPVRDVVVSDQVSVIGTPTNVHIT